MREKISLASDPIDNADILKLTEWLTSIPNGVPKLTKGPLTLEYEAAFAKFVGTKYSVFVNSGSSAILLTALALSEGNYIRNKKVIVPALSWLTDISSFLALGYEVILCDCNLTDLSLDLHHLERLLVEHDCATVVVVSVLGLVPNMKELSRICQKYDSILLEDACESLGSKYSGQTLGSLGFAGFHSTYFGHHCSTIEGGTITTDDKDFYNLLVSLRSHGWSRDLDEKTQNEWKKGWGVDDFTNLYTFYHIGQNFRSTDLQAFIGLGQLDKLPTFVNQRAENFKTYQKLIKVNDLKLKVKDSDFISNFAYPIVSKRRKQIVQNLQENNIECRPLIAGNLSKSPMWQKRFGSDLVLVNCDIIHEFGMYVPNHQNLRENDIKFIADIVNNS